MDWPFDAITPGRPWPREDLLEVQPAGAEVVREGKLLPCLVVLYSVFGLVEKDTENGWVCVCVSMGSGGWGGVGWCQVSVFSLIYCTDRWAWNVCELVTKVRTLLLIIVWNIVRISTLTSQIIVCRSNNEKYKKSSILNYTSITTFQHKTNPKETSWPFPRSRTRSRSYFEGWLSSENDKLFQYRSHAGLMLKKSC